MRKISRALAVLLALALPFSSPAVAQGGLDALMGEESLRLAPVQWYAEDGEYTMTLHPRPVTVTEDWLAGQGLTAKDLEDQEDFSLASQETTVPVPDPAALFSGLRVVSVLPDGKTLLLDMNGGLGLFDGENLRAVTVDLTRCEPSAETGYKDSIGLPDTLHRMGIGRTGYLWSPDGRFALVNNASETLRRMKSIYGMTLLDAREGALFMARACAGRSSLPNGWFIQQACFDPASGLLYYTVYEDRKTKLRRYDPATGAEETLCELEGIVSCEGMGWNARGELECVLRSGESNYLTRFSGEPWTYTQQPVTGLGACAYLAATPAATLLATGIAFEHQYAWQFLLVNRDMRRIVVRLQDGVAKEYAKLAPAYASPGEWGEDIQTDLQQHKAMRVIHMALSSDGRYAVLVCSSEGPTYRAFLMDTDTLALRPVELSALESDIQEKGPGFALGTRGYEPGLSFTGGDRYILLPFANGDTALCELVPKEAP